VRAGGWTKLDVAPVVNGIEGSVLGIIGYGRIGKALARRASGFDMTVIYHDVAGAADSDNRWDATPVALEELLRLSDFVSLHVDLNPTTHHLIDATRLRMMKPSAYLINTSRGGVVDQQALYAALEDKVIAGAALDVIETEPPPPAEPIIGHPRALVLPHVGASTRAARRRMAAMAIDNLLSGLGVTELVA
jgi:glyoxylate reductase